MGELILWWLYFSLLFNEDHLGPLFYHFLHLLHRLFYWFFYWLLHWLFLYFLLGIQVESVSDAVLDDISEFLNIEHIEAGNGLIAVLLFDIVFDVVFKV